MSASILIGLYMTIFAGLVNDRVSQRAALMWSAGMALVGNMAMAAAQGPTMAILGALVVGFGGGFSITAVLSATVAIDPADSGTRMGIVASMFSLSVAVFVAIFNSIEDEICHGCVATLL